VVQIETLCLSLEQKADKHYQDLMPERASGFSGIRPMEITKTALILTKFRLTPENGSTLPQCVKEDIRFADYILVTLIVNDDDDDNIYHHHHVPTNHNCTFFNLEKTSCKCKVQRSNLNSIGN